jgi:hypothetical protein
MLATIQRFEATKMLFSTTDGYIGLGPKNSRGGDVVVIILGAGVPFILRPTNQGVYRLVGECYVHGIMDGEFGAGCPPVADFLLE